MILQLDPRIPHAWRSPTELQFGLERQVLVLGDLSPTEERAIAALEIGVSRAGLDALLPHAHEQPRALDVLLERLKPVLRSPRAAPSPRIPIALDGRGPTAARIGAVLAASGFDVTSDIADVDRVRMAVIVAQFAIRPERHGRWLRRDVPHLPVVFSDLSATIGPLVEPGDGPCLGCVELHRRDADQAWPALATQLCVRDSALESALVSTAVAAIASRTVIARARGASRRFVDTAVRYDAASGVTDVVQCRPHEECGCRARQEIATLPADRAAGRSPTS